MNAFWSGLPGVWIGGMQFDPYGTLVDSTGSLLGLRYRWTGREWDAETGFYYHRARYYEPGAMRFISEDPIGYAGGANLYAYVGGRALEARDPGGMVAETVVPRGFSPFCTVSGSCVSVTGEVSPGGLSAAEELIHWGGAGWERYRLSADYKIYVEAFLAAKEKYTTTANGGDAFAQDSVQVFLTYLQLYEQATAISRAAFFAVFTGVRLNGASALGSSSQLHELLAIRFEGGLIFSNPVAVAHLNGLTGRGSTFGWTGSDITVLGEIGHNWAAAVVHETIHAVDMSLSESQTWAYANHHLITRFAPGARP